MDVFWLLYQPAPATGSTLNLCATLIWRLEHFAGRSSCKNGAVSIGSGSLATREKDIAGMFNLEMRQVASGERRVATSR